MARENRLPITREMLSEKDSRKRVRLNSASEFKLKLTNDQIEVVSIRQNIGGQDRDVVCVAVLENGNPIDIPLRCWASKTYVDCSNATKENKTLQGAVDSDALVAIYDYLTVNSTKTWVVRTQNFVGNYENRTYPTFVQALVEK